MNNDINQYDYDLPDGRVALYPADPRDSSKMLYLPKESGAPEHKQFTDLPDFLKAGDLLVFNNSRVFPARLYGKKLKTVNHGKISK